MELIIIEERHKYVELLPSKEQIVDYAFFILFLCLVSRISDLVDLMILFC